MWYGDSIASDYEAFAHETMPVKPLADYVQGLGLKFGVHLMRGIPWQIKFKNAIIIWAADIPESEDKYLAFFNQWETKTPVDIKVSISDIGLEADIEYKVRDLWARKDMGTCRTEFSAPIKMHGAGLFKISK